ncbi:unnamed protein product [Hermetia illucens]|uniref:Carboxylesterase type B domain-containing protein n=2 Tax=Hermetia illucens TaxID=343691 RepID=A0A7R8UTY6_HERIL|nr:unnamed protein product [Hermetia illucens]
MNVVKTKYGPLRGVVVRSNPTVEAFLGVPYASPPVGSLRYMPPVTPSTWRNTRLADRFSAVCPQVAPVAPSGPEALLEVPRGRLAQLRRLLPLLANQSEDCLYLNLYVPRMLYPTPPSSSGTTGFGGDAGATGPGLGTSSSSTDGIHNIPNDSPEDKPIPAILYIHGESYEWNSGNPYDGSVLAAHGNVIVVTINFRLGVLGFLKTGGKGSAQGNFGLMDLVAGLHWLRENLPAFGGDPNKVTVMGHGTGAALANILIVSPVASDLVHRGVLLSGSALSPWAIQKDPLFVKRRVAEQTGCHGDLLVDDLAPCLRTKSIAELLAVKIDSPRFLPGFAPFIDGTVIVHPSGGAAGPLTLPAGSAIASTSGIELADFPNRELIFGLTTIESYLDLSAQDLEFGFNETRRDRILRTYVRNIYHYHLNEIYAALKNEYTDWERPVRNPMGSRDASLEFLSDGHTAAPLIRLGYLHSLRGGRSYFLHFRHQSGERDFPQRGGSVRGEDVPFCLGLPISPLFPHNYTKQDIKISRILIRYLTNFALTGNPNENPTASVDISHVVHNSKTALVSSSLSLASSLSPHSSPPSMSLVRERTDETEDRKSPLVISSRSQIPSLSTLSSSSESASKLSIEASSPSVIQKHVPSQQYASSLIQHQSLSSATSSISTSVLSAASSTSSVVSISLPLSSASTAETFVVQSTDHRQKQQSSSSSSLSSTSSSSYQLSKFKDTTVFIAPPIHTVIKSKRHAVAAHRRKRKTNKRMPGIQDKHLTKKANNYRKKFLAENGGDGSSFGDRIRKSFPASSSSFLADEGAGDRRISRESDPGEDSPENEDDEDEEETNSDEEHPDHDEDDDEENENNPNSLNNNDDDEDNNSKNSEDVDENGEAGGGSEKFDRFGSSGISTPPRLPFWDTYDAINQLYLEMGNKVEVRNHYRGHKLSMWLSLIPQLHSPGDLAELPMRHHHFMEDSAQYYDGIIRPQIMQRPSFPKAPIQQQNINSGGGSHRQSQSSGTGTRTTTTIPKTDHPGFNVGIPATTECPPNTTIVPTIAATRPQNHQQKTNNPGRESGTGSNSGVISDAGSAGNKQDNNLFRRLASSQFQSYTTALTVTIAVGCFLLLLNVLIFAGIYYQREKRATDAKKKELLREAENLCTSTTNLEKLSGGEGAYPGNGGGGKSSRKSSLQSLTGFNSSGSFGEYSCYDEKIQCKEKHALADICSVELPLKEFKSSGSPAQSNTGSLRRQPAQSNPGSNPSSSNILMYPPSYHHQTQPTTHGHKAMHHYPSPDRQGRSNSGELVTYQQFQKPSVHQHFHQTAHPHHGHQFHAHQGAGATSSATVGTSTEQCNQSTQSEQPKVQDVATSIDERAVGGGSGSENNSERGSSSGGGGSSTGTTLAAGTNSSINDADNMISPGIPEPPPPPKSSAPYQGGILRQPGPPTTPSSNKKRVQIQEISV